MCVYVCMCVCECMWCVCVCVCGMYTNTCVQCALVEAGCLRGTFSVDSSSVEEMEPTPMTVTADLPIPVTPDQEVIGEGGGCKSTKEHLSLTQVQTFRLMSIVNHIGKGSGGGKGVQGNKGM